MRNKKTRLTTRLSSPAKTTTPQSPTHDEIVARAHAIWMEQGCRDGHDVEHWTEAERQLREEVARNHVRRRESIDGFSEAGDSMTSRVIERLDDTATPRRRASVTSMDLDGR